MKRPGSDASALSAGLGRVGFHRGPGAAEGSPGGPGISLDEGQSDRPSWSMNPTGTPFPAEFIAGAEEEHRRLTGRPMTAEELARTLRRYPGDS